ncbi:MAG: amino acid adenylation domain-containing protein, partial [bacterium]|nr:amino acid adenylation domain-containing protein [bacterium]
EFRGRGGPPWAALNGHHYDVNNINEGGKNNDWGIGDDNQGSHRGLPLQNFIRPFDLSEAPLLRSLLIRQPDQSYIWVLDMHHIISDGTSQAIFLEDFMALFHERSIEPLRLQYKDYSSWQNSLYHEGRIIKAQQAYWLDIYPPGEEIPRLNFPADAQRPAVFTFDGAHYGFKLDSEDAMKFKALGNRVGATLYMNLLALLNVLFYKTTGQTDMILGSVIFGRPHADLQAIIGMFVNTLAMRNFPVGEKTYETFLTEVIARSVDAFENQDVPFEELVDKLELERDISRNPLFDVSMSFQNIPQTGEAGSRNLDDDTSRWIELSPDKESLPNIDYKRPASRFDMTFFAYEIEEDIQFNIEYYTAIFKRETITRLARHFQALIKQVIDDPSKCLKDFDILSEEEKQQLLYEFNDTHAPYPEDKTIHRSIEEQVERSPDSLALITRSALISYRQLNESASRLAAGLIEKGIQPGSIVAIMMERSMEMVIGIIGVLKAGAAYLPIDPGYPQERIDFMLKDSNAIFCISDDSRKGKKNDQLSIINYQLLMKSSAFSASSAVKSGPASLAYVIYTSGSTGQPKGVMLEHRGCVNMLTDLIKGFELTPSDRVLQFASFTFDASVLEIFMTLFSGGGLVLVPKERLIDVPGFCNLLRRYSISSLILPPSFLKQLPRDNFPPLRVLLTGGEPPNPGDIYYYSQVTRYFNGYGPTETSVCVTYSEFPPGYRGTVTIGKPISNTSIFILDKGLQMAPVGIAGELCISGAGLARGYLNNPELTAERFLIFSHGRTRTNTDKTNTDNYKIVYNTGDLARWLVDGNIEFLGRIDHQVKIRGYRIELGEIENRLLEHDNIKEAVVKVYNGQDLCAYLVVSGEIETVELRDYLALMLPEYMIPSYFVFLYSIPVTSHGKINRKALPAPGTGIEAGKSYVAPRDPIEKKLTGLWAEVLQLDAAKIGIDDNFFQLGGHSLKTTTLERKIYKEFQLTIPLVEIFKRQTIRRLAQLLSSLQTPNQDAPIGENEGLVLLRKGTNPDQNLFFIHDGTGEIDAYASFSNYLDPRFNYWGIPAPRSDIPAPQNKTIEQLAGEYIQKIKHLQPHGPYRIAGWSIGGTIAFEMARQLEQADETVDFVALIDTSPPNAEALKTAAPFTFTVESELRWVREFLPQAKIKEDIGQLPDVSTLWREILHHFQTHETDADTDTGKLKHTLLGPIREAVPNYHELDIRSVFYYLNIIRWLDNARNGYHPEGKISTGIHFFQASSSAPALNQWNQYSNGDCHTYEVPGNHHSLFKPPGIAELAKQLDKTLTLLVK